MSAENPTPEPYGLGDSLPASHNIRGNTTEGTQRLTVRSGISFEEAARNVQDYIDRWDALTNGAQ